MNQDDWTGFAFAIGVCIGSLLSLQITSALAEYRHKRQLHGRINKIEGRVSSLKYDTRKKIDGLNLVPKSNEAVS